MLRRSKYSSMSALKRSTSNCTSSTRLFTEAACEDSSPSSRPLRVAMRLSVSSRMRAISALDQSRIPAMSSSDRLRRVAAPSVAPSRIDSVTSLASASICWSAWSRADDAVARIAADRSAISFDGFLGAAAGAAGASISTMRWDSSGSWVSVAAASVAAASGAASSGGRCPLVEMPRRAWMSVSGHSRSSDVGSACASAAGSAPSGAASSCARSELHGSLKPDLVSLEAMSRDFLYGVGTEPQVLRRQ